MGLVEATVLFLLALTIGIVDRDRRRVQLRLESQGELVRSFRRHTARQLRIYRRRMAALEEELAWDRARIDGLVPPRSIEAELTGIIPARHVRAAEVRAIEVARRQRFHGTPRQLDELLEQPEASSPG